MRVNGGIGGGGKRERTEGVKRGYESRFSVADPLPSFAEQTARPHFIYAQACFMAPFDTGKGAKYAGEGSRARPRATDLSSFTAGDGRRHRARRHAVKIANASESLDPRYRTVTRSPV